MTRGTNNSEGVVSSGETGGERCGRSVQAEQKENVPPTSAKGGSSECGTKLNELDAKAMVKRGGQRKKVKDPLAMGGLRRSNDHRKLQRNPRQEQQGSAKPELYAVEQADSKHPQWDQRLNPEYREETVSCVKRGEKAGTTKTISEGQTTSPPKSISCLPIKTRDPIDKQVECFGEISDPPVKSKIEGLETELLQHQIDGLKFLLKREAPKLEPKGGLLCDDMGLGKTIQSIALILSNNRDKMDLSADEGSENVSKTTLVVATAALIEQWKAEINDKAPGLAATVHHGPKKAKAKRVLMKNDVVITTYETLASDHGKKGPLQRVYWLRVILDEAQTIKNRKTKNAKACFALKAVSRWCLSGTPVQNNLDELYTLLYFLQINQDSPAPSTVGYSRRGQTKDHLSRLLGVTMLRRTKDDLVTAGEIKLPDRNLHREFVQFDSTERVFYDQIEHQVGSAIKRLLSKGERGGYMNAWVLLLRLRQICDHTSLANGPTEEDEETSKTELELIGLDAKAAMRDLSIISPSSKIKRLLQLIQHEPTRKTVVFSQFTSMLDIIGQFLEKDNFKFLKYYGSTGKKQRQKVLISFKQEDSTNILLVSLKAGACGLNLTFASRVILVDPWWNPMVGAQAIDRVHRIGQEHSVDVYELIIANSVEERILQLQERKLQLAKSVMEGGNNNKKSSKKQKNPGQEEMLQLFK